MKYTPKNKGGSSPRSPHRSYAYELQDTQIMSYVLCTRRTVKERLTNVGLAVACVGRNMYLSLLFLIWNVQLVQCIADYLCISHTILSYLT